MIQQSLYSTGYLPQRREHPYPKKYLHTDVHSGIIRSGQGMEATKVSYNRPLCHMYTMEYYSAITRDEILPFATAWRNLEIITLSKINQTEKVENHMISLICEI